MNLRKSKTNVLLRMAIVAVSAASIGIFTGCPNPSAEEQTRTIIVAVQRDSHVESVDPKFLYVDRGTQWSEIKNKIRVNYKDGYEFDAWRLDDIWGAKLSDGYRFQINTTVFVSSKEKAKALYKVQHFQQNLSADGYELKDTESLYGIIGEQTKAQAKTYEGFTEKPFTQQTIKNDGSVVVKIEYDRKEITLTFDLKGGTTETPLEEGTKLKGRFGTSFSIKNPTQEDMIFEKWEPAVPASFPSSDAVYTAKFRAPRLTIKGDERIKNKSDNFIEAGKGKTWKDIKTEAAKKAVFQFSWDTGDYGIHEWHLDDENGHLLTDNDRFAQDTTVYAVTNYTKFDWSGTTITGVTGEKPRGKIIIPARCTEIGNDAFLSAGQMTQVRLPGNLTSIGERAFTYCSSLQQVDFSSCTDLTSIDKSAFADCKDLQQVNLFRCSALTSIGEYAFNGCTALQEVDLSLCTHLTKISKGTFFFCNKLKMVKFPRDLTAIEEKAFSSCTDLTQADFSGCTKLSEIGVYAFLNCEKLTRVSMPENLRTIRDSAFKSCTGVSVFDFYACTAITKIEDAFWGCNKARFRVKYRTNVKDKLKDAGIADGRIDEIS